MNKRIWISVLALLIFPALSGFVRAPHTQHKAGQLRSLMALYPNLPKVDASFSDAPIEDVLTFLSLEYSLNIISDPKIKGKVTFTLKQVHPVEALDSIVSSMGYSWEYENGVFKVSTAQPVKVVKLQYLSAYDLYQDISKFVSKRGSIAMNQADNSLILSAPNKDLNTIVSMIKNMDTPPYQVLVEAKIIELTEESGLNVGLNVSYEFSADKTLQTTGLATDPAATTAKGAFYTDTSSPLIARVEAFAQKSGSDTLANPKILTVNHKTAKIITGKRLGYRTTTTTGTSVQEDINFLEVGTKLLITPHVTEDDNIVLDIEPEVSDGDIVNELPNETTTEAKTSVMVRDGQTLLLGGLVRYKDTDTDTGVPVLMSVPVLGQLFKRTEKSTEKTEIVVLITPKIVRPGDLSRMDITIEDAL